jgi:hypothetical protein
MVPSARSYVTADANGAVECVSEIPTGHFTIYSVPLRCSGLGQAGEHATAGPIVRPHGGNRIAAGAGLERRADYRRCAESEVGARQ